MAKCLPTCESIPAAEWERRWLADHPEEEPANLPEDIFIVTHAEGCPNLAWARQAALDKLGEE